MKYFGHISLVYYFEKQRLTSDSLINFSKSTHTAKDTEISLARITSK